MPSQVSKSPFAKIIDRAKSVHDKHWSEPVDYGNPSVPAGIEAGIAQLVECKFGEFKEGANKGQLYFLAAGVIIEPKTLVSGVSVEGLRTSIGPEPLCATPQSQGKRKTFEDHWMWVCNEIKKLLVKPGDPIPEIPAEAVEQIAEQLKEIGPYFRFRTWQGSPTPQFPNPRVNHQWNGLCDYTPGIAAPTVVDNTSPPNGEAGHGEPQQSVEAPEGFDEFSDLDSLVSAADSGDGAAMEKLRELGTANGISEMRVDEAKNWGEVRALIEAVGSASQSSSDTGADSAPWEPALEEVYKYCPIDPKTKKPVKKPVECEVMIVDSQKQTVTLKNLANPKVKYPAVKWSGLIRG